jgi:hypothetical protein
MEIQDTHGQCHDPEDDAMKDVEGTRRQRLMRVLHTQWRQNL